MRFKQTSLLNMVSINENEQGEYLIKISSSSLEVSLLMLGDGCVSLKLKSVFN